MGYEVIATTAVADACAMEQIAVVRATASDAKSLLEQKKADYLISIPSRATKDKAFEAGDHYHLRRAAVDYSIPVTTELENARMLVRLWTIPFLSPPNSKT